MRACREESARHSQLRLGAGVRLCLADRDSRICVVLYGFGPKLYEEMDEKKCDVPHCFALELV